MNLEDNCSCMTQFINQVIELLLHNSNKLLHVALTSYFGSQLVENSKLVCVVHLREDWIEWKDVLIY